MRRQRNNCRMQTRKQRRLDAKNEASFTFILAKLCTLSQHSLALRLASFIYDGFLYVERSCHCTPVLFTRREAGIRFLSDDTGSCATGTIYRLIRQHYIVAERTSYAHTRRCISVYGNMIGIRRSLPAARYHDSISISLVCGCISSP